MRQCMEINGKELKSREEDHNVRGVPHTESKSSGRSHLPEHQSATGWRDVKGIFFTLFFPSIASTVPQGRCYVSAWDVYGMTSFAFTGSWPPGYKTLDSYHNSKRFQSCSSRELLLRDNRAWGYDWDRLGFNHILWPSEEKLYSLFIHFWRFGWRVVGGVNERSVKLHWTVLKIRTGLDPWIHLILKWHVSWKGLKLIVKITVS